MKAQLMSDLHTEFHLKPLEFLAGLQFEPDLDFLLLPGDIVVLNAQSVTTVRSVFQFLASKARHVLYTTGNHEYYHSQRHEQVESTMKALFPPNFHWLDNENIELDGVVFYGGCLWFPNDPLNPFYRDQINDFGLIKDLTSWVYQSNSRFRADYSLPYATVVLSHHLPSPQSTPEMYRGSEINRFFVSDERDLILTRKPRYWVHGHTHTPCRYPFGDSTEVVCNPYGYPHERKFFREYAPVILEL